MNINANCSFCTLYPVPPVFIKKGIYMRKTIKGKKVLEAPLLNNKYVCPGCMDDVSFSIIGNESVKDEYKTWNCPIRFYAECKKCKVVVTYVKDLGIHKSNERE